MRRARGGSERRSLVGGRGLPAGPGRSRRSLSAGGARLVREPCRTPSPRPRRAVQRDPHLAPTIAWADQHGMRIPASPVPYALDDLDSASITLQAVLGTTGCPWPATPSITYRRTVPTGIDLGSGYVASCSSGPGLFSADASPVQRLPSGGSGHRATRPPRNASAATRRVVRPVRARPARCATEVPRAPFSRAVTDRLPNVHDDG